MLISTPAKGIRKYEKVNEWVKGARGRKQKSLCSVIICDIEILGDFFICNKIEDKLWNKITN